MDSLQHPTSRYTGFSIGGVAIEAPVGLAPMAGVTDAPFRRLARRLGAAFTVGEMVATRDWLKGVSREAELRAELPGPGPHIVQLVGREPQVMAEAARR
jgi:tRNA-dihydrouridine synthase B